MTNSTPSTSSPSPIAEIDHGPSKLDQFLENHQKKLIIAAILIALGVAGYVVWSGLAEAKAQEAGSALTAATTVEDYQKVISQWPDSKAAASAMLLLADAQWKDAPEESIATLKSFIEKYPESQLLPTAQVSLALRLLDQEKLDAAKEILTEVVEDDEAAYIAPLAAIALGDIAKEEGNIEEATTWYKKAQEDPAGLGNTYKNIVSIRLALVKAKPPVKIKPALPTPPKPTLPAPPLAPSANQPKN